MTINSNKASILKFSIPSSFIFNGKNFIGLFINFCPKINFKPNVLLRKNVKIIFLSVDDKESSKILNKYKQHRMRNSVGEWLGCSCAVLGVDGSSLLTASQRCDGLNSPYA